MNGRSVKYSIDTGVDPVIIEILPRRLNDKAGTSGTLAPSKYECGVSGMEVDQARRNADLASLTPQIPEEQIIGLVNRLFIC